MAIAQTVTDLNIVEIKQMKKQGVIVELNSTVTRQLMVLQRMIRKYKRDTRLTFQGGRVQRTCSRDSYASHRRRYFKVGIRNPQLMLCKQVTYLGVIFDYKLNWNLHIEAIIKRAHKGVNIIR